MNWWSFTWFVIALAVLYFPVLWLCLIAGTLVFPFLFLANAERWVAPPSYVVDLIERSGVPAVELYIDNIKQNDTLPIHCAAFACALFPRRHVIVFDEEFLRVASSVQVMFVLGHELGHHKMGHTRLLAKIKELTRFTFGLHLACAEYDLDFREAAADEYARLLTGCPQTVLHGLRFPSSNR